MRKENFDLFCGLMRLSYNDKHLELVAWAEDAAQLSREQQRAFLRDAARLLRESYMLHAGIGEVCYLWGEELAFCTKFAPFIGSQNNRSSARSKALWRRFRRMAIRRSYSPILPLR